MTELDEMFVDAHKVAEQEEKENQFRGNILSNFVKIEQIMMMVIDYYNSKKNSDSRKPNERRISSTGWKLSELKKIIKDKDFKNCGFDFSSIMDRIDECKKLRNQLAHNITYPGSSHENAKEGKGNITMIFFEKDKWQRVDFTKKEQEGLEQEVYSTYRNMREMYLAIVQVYGDHLTLAI